MLQTLREKMKHTQRGAIMVFFALLVPLFLGMIGFAVDAGFLYMQKAKLQDIADAAALAGAGHLNDGDDPSRAKVTSAVSAFAASNGYKGTGTSNNYVYGADYTSDDAVTLGVNDKWKLAQKVEPKVMDKDNKQRDHVRVLMVKRVPTFFIRFLFPKQESVVVKALAVAEYVEGEAPVASGDVPVIMVEAISSDSFNHYQSADNIVLGKNFSFPIYVKNGAIYASTTKLPGTGNLYVNNIGDSQASFDKDRNKIVWNPSINDRDVYCPGYYPSGTDAFLTEEFKKQYQEIRGKADDKYDETKRIIEKDANDKANDIEAYKNGEDNKRYIGLDASGKPYSNIKEEDSTIELYMSGTYFETTAASPSVFLASSRSVLTNRQLKNVQTITTLVSDKPCMIGTKGITYGNIYLLKGDGIGLDIAGSNNKFNGTLYSPGNLYVGGENNHFLGDASSSAAVSILGRCVYLGQWIPISESIVTENSFNFKTNVWKVDECVKINYNSDTFIDAKNDSNWRIYFGYDSTGSGSSSGSSGSDTASKSRVRLVI